LFAALITLLLESRTNMLAFFVEAKPIVVLHKQCNKLLNELVGHFGLRKGELKSFTRLRYCCAAVKRNHERWCF
jgi:hypothetical protein